MARVWVLVAVAGVLAATGLVLSPVAGAFACGLGLVLGVLAFQLAQGGGRRLPPWIIAAGAATVGLGGAWAVGGAVVSGLIAGLLGLVVFSTGAQASLFQDALPDGVELPDPLSLRTQAAVAIDESLRLLWAVTAMASPPPKSATLVEDLRAAAERHREAGILDDPAVAHPRPPALEKVSLVSTPVWGAGRAELLRFESEYEPRDPEIRDRYIAVEPNRTAHVHLWRHGDRPRPTLICLHGYGMGRIGWDARAFDVDGLHRKLGLDVAVPTLPLHGPRAIGRRSGAGFLDDHPLQTNAAFGQAIWDLRRLAGWLRQQGAPAVGVYGMSLGGYLTALWASLDADLACAIPSIPLVALQDLMERDLRPEERRAREAGGISAQVWRDVWAPHSPLAHKPRVSKEASLILAARADRICPPSQAHALWEHWDRPSIHWTPGSHLVPIGRRETRERLAHHLETTLVAAATPTLSKFRRVQA
ncbi:MAG: alpha/beta hydrolase [Deltaproteobacteria bacterium]|nr:alpha/beta hydrolase [Deltaproteobacteria bacterium]MBW2397364.1 alpha/beta hydrolase [Deltaproteobacteria bacterium]